MPCILVRLVKLRPVVLELNFVSVVAVGQLQLDWIRVKVLDNVLDCFEARFISLLVTNSVVRVHPATDWNMEYLTTTQYRYYIRPVRSGIAAVSNDEAAILSAITQFLLCFLTTHPCFIP